MYIMGHSLQAVSVLVQAACSVFAVPLTMRIHEGLIWSNRDKRTLLDKMLSLLTTLAVTQPYYFLADAYYAAGKMVNTLLRQGNHLITRAKSQEQRHRICSARAQRIAKARTSEALREENQAQLVVQRHGRLPERSQSGLWGKESDPHLPGLRSDVAPGQAKGAIRARRASQSRHPHTHEHGYLPGGATDHSSLRAPLQN